MMLAFHHATFLIQTPATGFSMMYCPPVLFPGQVRSLTGTLHPAQLLEGRGLVGFRRRLVGFIHFLITYVVLTSSLRHAQKKKILPVLLNSQTYLNTQNF